jgi:hypothetical protein
MDKSTIKDTSQNPSAYYIKPCNDDEFFIVKTINVVVGNISEKEYTIECIKKKELTFDYKQLNKLNTDFTKKQNNTKTDEIEFKYSNIVNSKITRIVITLLIIAHRDQYPI